MYQFVCAVHVPLATTTLDAVAMVLHRPDSCTAPSWPLADPITVKVLSPTVAVSVSSPVDAL